MTHGMTVVPGANRPAISPVLVLVLFLLSISPLRGAGTFDDGVVAYDAGQYQAAAEIWEPLARQGHVLSQFNLGLLYETGTGVPARPDLAFFWYQLAAMNGHENAQYNLGGLYFRGQGVQRSIDQAMHWWEESANAGNPNAAYNLGIVLMGNGRDPDGVDAAMIRFRQAAQAGHPQAAEWLTRLGGSENAPQSLFFGVPPQVPALESLAAGPGDPLDEGDVPSSGATDPPPPPVSASGLRDSPEPDSAEASGDSDDSLRDGRLWLDLQPDDAYTLQVGPFYDVGVASFYLGKWGFGGPGAVFEEDGEYHIALGSFPTRGSARKYQTRLRKMVPESRHKQQDVVTMQRLKR